MRKKRRNRWLLVLGISGISAMGWYTNSYQPDTTLKIAIFFFLFFGTSFSITHFIFSNVRRAFLLSCFLTIFLLLRLLSLHEPIYIILLLASLASLELLFSKR